MLERMGDYTKGRDRARALSRVDEVHQFFVLPCFLLPGPPGDHRRATYDIQDEEDVFLFDSYVFSGEAISNKAFDDHIFA